MLEPLRRFDHFFVSRVQTAYDYLWDRWGVMLGDCMAGGALPFAGLAAYHMGEREYVRCFSTCGLIVIAVVNALRARRAQSATKQTAYNIEVLIQREQYILRAPLFVFLTMGAIAVELREFIFDAGWFSMVYLPCVLLRERDDTRFRRHRLVSQPQ